MQPCNLRFLLEDIFTEPSAIDKNDTLNPAHSDIWHSSYCDNLEQDNQTKRIFFRMDKDSDKFKISSIGGSPRDTEFQAVLHGKGYIIANALRWGFNTDLDVAKRLHISKRTADRIMHPKEKYADTSLHFKHVIQIKTLDDDYQYHWVKKPVKHPTKYHKWDWKLQKDNIIGRFKPQTVVDEHTFEQYRIMFNSPLQKMIRKHYSKKPQGYILQTLYQKQRIIAIQKYKIKIMSILMKIFKGNKLNKYPSFTNYLASLNRIYVSLVYKAERLNHIKRDWKLPIQPTKFTQTMGSIFNATNDVLKISPITLSLSPEYYTFDNRIKNTITSAMLYWYLYTQKKYYLIPYPKQFILHKVWMHLYQNKDKFRKDSLSKFVNYPDSNPNIKNPFQSRALHNMK